MTDKNFILEQAERGGMRAFFVRDASGDMVAIYDTPMSKNERFEELRKFLDSNNGVFKIELRNEHSKGMYPRAAQRGKILIGEYEVLLEKAPSRGVSGIDVAAAGGSNISMLQSYERELRELDRKVSTLQNELSMKDLAIERLKDQHARELAEAKSDDRRIQSYLSQMNGLFNQVPGRQMNGIGDVNETKEMSKKERLVNAVNQLVKADPECAEKLEKLARLANTNRAQYDQAAALLDNFI